MRAGIVKIDGALHQPQFAHLSVIVEVRLSIAREPGDVVQPKQHLKSLVWHCWVGLWGGFSACAPISNQRGRGL